LVALPLYRSGHPFLIFLAMNSIYFVPVLDRTDGVIQELTTNSLKRWPVIISADSTADLLQRPSRDGKMFYQRQYE